MEKTEAIAYINKMLDQEQPRAEIISGLMEKLHAPEAIVTKFVAQIEANYEKEKSQAESSPVSPASTTLPPWLEELPADIESEVNPTIAPIASQLDQAGDVGTNKISDIREAASFVSTEFANGRPQYEIVNELAMRTGEPRDLTEQFVALTISRYTASLNQDIPREPTEPTAIDLNKPEYVHYVVNQLAKHRQRNDIIMTICERTGAPWSEAQRFVGQVKAEQHNTIQARMNRFIIALCFGTIIVGFLLTAGTIFPLLYELAERAEEFKALVGTSDFGNHYIKAAPFIFITGAALIITGILGLVLAKQTQVD